MLGKFTESLEIVKKKFVQFGDFPGTWIAIVTRSYHCRWSGFFRFPRKTLKPAGNYDWLEKWNGYCERLGHG